jgi:hypothetical protein
MQDNYKVPAHIEAEDQWVRNASNPCNLRFDETDHASCFGRRPELVHTLSVADPSL